MLVLPYKLLVVNTQKNKTFAKKILSGKRHPVWCRSVGRQSVNKSTQTETTTMSDLNIDPKKTLAVLGGRAATWRRLEKAGFQLGLKTIEKWVERGNIPTNRIAQIAICAKEDGRPVELYDLIVGMTPVMAKNQNKNQ